MSSVAITISDRIKEINNQIRRCKTSWKKANKDRSGAMKKYPSYTDEYGRWQNPYEYELEYKDAEHRVDCAIKKEIAIVDERKYLRGLLKGNMTNFDKYHWEYE